MNSPAGDFAAVEAVLLALALYARGAVSAGKAVELAGVTRMEFERLLGERQIARSYGQEDLEHDLAWAKAGPGLA